MQDLCADLLAEYMELAALAETLTSDQWSIRTDFYGWTPFDEIAHLCFFDQAGLLAVTDAVAFAHDRQEVMAELASGSEISVLQRRRYGHLSGPDLVLLWREQYTRLVEALSGLDSQARLPWYGPNMSARSFATARLMESWAHGQDIYDALHLRRRASARLKHIAHLGVSTFGWSFANRGITVPEQRPHIALTAPDGKLWTWNPPSSVEYLRGGAEDFCLLVTQRRHLNDLRLEYGGASTSHWLAIAQCFAGPPAAGPAPGKRG